MNRSDIHFPPKHEPLRDDVHALGAMVGEILREQGGEQLFELVELDRVAAIRGRCGSGEARAELAACVRERPPALARDLVRAFSTWFQAVNLAEKVHRIRRRRDYFLKDSQRPQPGGVEDAIAELKERGLTQAEAVEAKSWVRDETHATRNVRTKACRCGLFIDCCFSSSTGSLRLTDHRHQNWQPERSAASTYRGKPSSRNSTQWQDVAALAPWL